MSEIDPKVRRYALSNWLGLVATLGPAFAVPVLVAFQVSSEDHASFSIAWSIALVLFQVPHLTGSVLLSEGSRLENPRKPAASVLAISVMATGLGTLLATLGADRAAALYGPEFEDVATVLPPVCAATVAWAVTSVALSLCRVRGDNRGVVAVSAAFAVLTLGVTVVGSIADGTTGAAVGWLVGNVCAAVFASAVALGRTGERATFGDVAAAPGLP